MLRSHGPHSPLRDNKSSIRTGKRSGCLFGAGWPVWGFEAELHWKKHWKKKQFMPHNERKKRRVCCSSYYRRTEFEYRETEKAQWLGWRSYSRNYNTDWFHYSILGKRSIKILAGLTEMCWPVFLLPGVLQHHQCPEEKQRQDIKDGERVANES